jgi:hypothetical protein
MMLRKKGISTSLPLLSDQTKSRPRDYDLAYILNHESGLGSSQSIHEDPHAPVQSADTVDDGVTVEERRFPPPVSSGGTGMRDLSHAVLYSVFNTQYDLILKKINIEKIRFEY